MALQHGLIGSSSMPPNGGAFIVASPPHLMFDHFPFSWLYGYMAPQPGLIGSSGVSPNEDALSGASHPHLIP